MSKIGFDHCYRYMSSPEEYRALKERGFSIDESYMVEHPGSHQCWFLAFPAPKHVTEGSNKNYLEFIHIKDVEVNRAHRISENRPLDELSTHMPGFSLATDQGLEDFFSQTKEDFSKFGVTFTHKNYDWKQNSTERLLGWNYMSFKKEIYPYTYIWLTQYERTGEKTSSSTIATIHPNTCSGFEGFIFGEDKDNLKNFETLAATKIKEGRLSLADGLTIWIADPKLQSVFKDRKRYNFFAAVLKCADFEKFKQLAKPESLIDFQGRKAGLIELTNQGWDILVVS